MKQLLLFVFIVLNMIAYSQDDKTVTLVASGQGKTQDEAKQNALRNAIEQAFGAFISSNTEILNDEIVKDEIVSLSNGNIEKYVILSEKDLGDHKFAVTLNATVSLVKLNSYSTKKGVSSEYNGSLFAFNTINDNLKDANEVKLLGDIFQIAENVLKKSFYGDINMNDPKLLNGDYYEIPFDAKINVTKSYNEVLNYVYESMKGLSITKESFYKYLENGKSPLEVILLTPNKPFNSVDHPNLNSFSNMEILYFRNKASQNLINAFFSECDRILTDFSIVANENNKQQLSKLTFANGSKPIILPRNRSCSSRPNELINSDQLWTIQVGDKTCLLLEEKNVRTDSQMHKKWEKYACSSLKQKESQQKIKYSTVMVAFNLKNENTTILNVKGSVTNSLAEIKKINSFQIIYQ
jgi:serine/threonine protein phosphatase PrpC